MTNKWQTYNGCTIRQQCGVFGPYYEVISPYGSVFQVTSSASGAEYFAGTYGLNQRLEDHRMEMELNTFEEDTF